MKKPLVLLVLISYLVFIPQPVAAFNPMEMIGNGLAAGINALLGLFNRGGGGGGGEENPGNPSLPSIPFLNQNENEQLPILSNNETLQSESNSPLKLLEGGGDSKLDLLDNISPGSSSSIGNISSLLDRIKGISGNSGSIIDTLGSNKLDTGESGGALNSLREKIGLAEGLIGGLNGAGTLGSSIGDLEALRENLLGQKFDLQQLSGGLAGALQPQQPGSIASALNGFGWVKKEDMPTPRNEVASAIVGGKIYIMGGNIEGGTTTTKVEIYDPTSGSWTNGPDMPAPRNHAKAVAIGSTIYLIGGFSGNFLNYEYHPDVYALDTTSGQWSTKAPLPTNRGAFGADVIGGKIYVAGGTGPEGMTNVLEIYDPGSDSWASGKSMPTTREHLTATTFNSKLYTLGGRKVLFAKIFSNLGDVEVYDPGSDSWTKAPPMPTARSGTASSIFNNMIVVVGGEELTSIHNAAEAFNPATGTWHKLPNLPTGRHGLSANTVNGNLYIIGGGATPGLMMGVSGANEALSAQ